MQERVQAKSQPDLHHVRQDTRVRSRLLSSFQYLMLFMHCAPLNILRYCPKWQFGSCCVKPVVSPCAVHTSVKSFLILSSQKQFGSYVKSVLLPQPDPKVAAEVAYPLASFTCTCHFLFVILFLFLYIFSFKFDICL